MPYCDVVSLGRHISGKLMAITGKLTHDSSGSKEYLMFSSCKLSEIEVLLPRNKRREGTSIHYSLHYNVALVRAKEFDDVSCDFCFKSGDLMASSGKRIRWSGPFHYPKLDYSTCRITKAGIGGPLVDDDGNFIGMNFYDPKLGTLFLFCDHIVDILDCFKKGIRFALDSKICISRTGAKLDGDDSVRLNNP
uniref:Uncharacterized protein n=1 Tax=Oryza punctata TaxID=4537 RepID=A0A0E0M7M2_ORYPU